MLSQLNLGFWALWESFKGMKRWRFWAPFLVLGIAQLLLVLALTQFHQPMFAWLFVPILERTFGPAVLHYPNFYLALPDLFSRINMFMDFLLGAFTIGVAALIIWRSAARERSGTPWSDAGKRYFALLFGRLPAFLLILAMSAGLPLLVGPPQDGEFSGNQIRIVRYGSFVLGIVIEALFVYTPILLLVERRKVGPALAAAVRLFLRTPIATLLLVFLPNLLQLPLSAVLRRAEMIKDKLSPEMIAVMVMFTIAGYLLVNYLMIASAVRVYGARAEEVR